MSQSSLLTQLKLQRKLQKSQSQLQISESLDELGEEEEELEDEIDLHEGVAGEELQENIARLVLFSFFYLHFHQLQGESWGRFNLRRTKLLAQFFPILPKPETFPLFPVHSLVSAYPLAIVCECGEKVGEGNFGIIQSCFHCYGMGRKPTYWPADILTEVSFRVPRPWVTWAKSVAIQLETSRKSNRNSVTDLEKENEPDYKSE